MLKEFFQILFFPIYLLIVFPILLILSGLRIPFVFPFLNYNNGRYIALIDKKFYKYRLNLFKKLQPSLSSHLSEDKLGNLNVYLTKNSNQTNKFKAKIIDKNKQKALICLHKIINKNLISLEELKKDLIEIDKSHHTQLYQYIIKKNGEFPNFVKTDFYLWDCLEDIYTECMLDDEPETLFDPSFKPDSPVGPGIGSEKTINDNYFDEMLIEEPLEQKLRFYLSRYPYYTSSTGRYTNLIQTLGEWTQLTDPFTQHYMSLSIFMSNGLSNSKSREKLDFSIRHIIYGLIQAADNELMKRVSVPFKEMFSWHKILEHDNQSDFEKFLVGSYPPTMAGIAKFLDRIKKNKMEITNEVEKNFIQFIEKVDYLTLDNITEKSFIQKLYLMGRLRGSLMHPGKFNTEDADNVISFLLDDKMPGDFFYKIGIDIGY